MRQLHPPPAPGLAAAAPDPDQLHAGLTFPAGRTTAEGVRRPWVALGMVSSLDGAAAVDGRTADLGGAGDLVAFRRLRDACDAILVGAGTVREEDYGPPRGTEARRADRAARGLAPTPRLVVVTRRAALSREQRIFDDAALRPLVATVTTAPADVDARLAAVADVVRVGEGDVDLSALLDHLGGLGLWRVLCEGGPSVNGALLASDLVDEVFVTVAPVAIGGPAPRIAVGPDEVPPRAFELVSVHEHGSELLLRYQRRR